MKCELCPPIEKKTSWHYEDELVVLLDCETCKIPMLVLKRHTMEPTQNEIEYMEKIVKWQFGENYYIRRRQKKIIDHLHWHVEMVNNNK